MHPRAFEYVNHSILLGRCGVDVVEDHITTVDPRRANENADNESRFRSLTGADLVGALVGCVPEHGRAIVALADRGVEHPHEVAAWHGTSLEAVILASRLGRLAGAAVPHGEAAAGHLFFYPAVPEDFTALTHAACHSDGRPGAELYASGNARHHLLMRICDVDFSDVAAREKIYAAVELIELEPEGIDVADSLRELGVRKRDVAATIAAVQARAGVLFALSARALTTFSLSDGDRAGGDRKICTPDGLPLDALVGIHACGPIERAFIEELRRATA